MNNKRFWGLLTGCLFLILGTFGTLQAVPKDVTKTCSGREQIEAMVPFFGDTVGDLFEESKVGEAAGLSFVKTADRQRVLRCTVQKGVVDMDAVTLSRRLFDHATPLDAEEEGVGIGNVDLTIERILRLSRGKYRVDGSVYRNAGAEKKTEDLRWGTYRLYLTAAEHTYYGFTATSLNCRKLRSFETFSGAVSYSSKAGKEIVSTALRYVGGKYVWGGTSLRTGVDCSGFVYCILRATGHYHGGRLHSTDWNNVGKAVAVKDARAGDIIVWDGHVAIYMGGGKMVHASNSKPYPKGGIKVSRIRNPRTYSKSHKFMGIRRVQ